MPTGQVFAADPHHNAAEGDQRGRGKPEFSTWRCGDDHISSGFQLSVSLDHDAAAQIIEQQRSMSFRET